MGNFRIVPLYRVQQDYDYESYDIAPHLQDEVWARLGEGSDVERATRGESLRSRWDERWVFVPYGGDADPRPRGLGDLAMFSGHLLGTTNPEAAALMRPFLRGAENEELSARLESKPLVLFNVRRSVNRADLWRLPADAVFRLNPIRNDVLCSDGFKDAIERSGFKGIRFRPVDPDAHVPML